MSGYGIVVSLEEGREDGAVGGLDGVDFLDVCGEVVGETELLGWRAYQCVYFFLRPKKEMFSKISGQSRRRYKYKERCSGKENRSRR